MTTQQLAGSMDPELVRMIDNGHYFGPTGALAYAREEVLPLAKQELWNDRYDYAMQYINVLYSAASFASKQRSVGKKIYALHLLLSAWSWAKDVRSTAKYDTIDSGQWHILMSVYARVLQVMKKLRLLRVMSKVRRELDNEIETDYIGIHRRAIGADENSLEKRMDLMAAGLLCELESDGLYSFGSGERIKAGVRRYVEENKGSTDRDTAQMVARLARALGDKATAHAVASRAGNRDQVAKAR
jgi:hypothetical protein